MENKMNFTPEQLELAADTASPAALMALAKEQGIELTAEQAADYYARLHPENGALSDEELDNVSGGFEKCKPDSCGRCSSKEFEDRGYSAILSPGNTEHIYVWTCVKCGWVEGE